MDNNIKFIDLFSGIGGIRMAYEKEGYKCVFSSEINPHACEMYKANFGEDPYCDITKVDANIIPDFDVLCAGFPCQAFSISGKQKGFYDETRGTLFFDICRILEAKQPKAFMLENVQNLEKHDNGTTLKVMINSLENLGYTVQYKVLNAKDFDVPQNRERIIIIGNKLGKIFDFSKLVVNTATDMKKYLDNWYVTNILNKKTSSGISFANYVADSNFCNDRSLFQGNGYEISSMTKYSPFNRIMNLHKPSLKCPQSTDVFKVSNNNLTYPIALLTSDEINFAGAFYNYVNTKYYLYINKSFWTMSPSQFTNYSALAYIWFVNTTGGLNNHYTSLSNGVRPVIIVDKARFCFSS